MQKLTPLDELKCVLLYIPSKWDGHTHSQEVFKGNKLQWKATANRGSKTDTSNAMENKGTTKRTLITNIRTSWMNKKNEYAWLKQRETFKYSNYQLLQLLYIEHFIGGNIWY